MLRSAFFDRGSVLAIGNGTKLDVYITVADAHIHKYVYFDEKLLPHLSLDLKLARFRGLLLP